MCWSVALWRWIERAWKNNFHPHYFDMALAIAICLDKGIMSVLCCSWQLVEFMQSLCQTIYFPPTNTGYMHNTPYACSTVQVKGNQLVTHNQLPVLKSLLYVISKGRDVVKVILDTSEMICPSAVDPTSTPLSLQRRDLAFLCSW